MVAISKLKPGMKVRIVDEWNQYTYENKFGKMDHWLGQVMTVRRIDDHKYVRMEEDCGELFDAGWHWNAHCIAEIVADAVEPVEMTVPDQSDIWNMFMGG